MRFFPKRALRNRRFRPWRLHYSRAPKHLFFLLRTRFDGIRSSTENGKTRNRTLLYYRGRNARRIPALRRRFYGTMVKTHFEIDILVFTRPPRAMYACFYIVLRVFQSSFFSISFLNNIQRSLGLAAHELRRNSNDAKIVSRR